MFSTALASRASAQFKHIEFVRDTAFNLGLMGVPRATSVVIRRDGHMLVAPNYYGTAYVFDSLGKKQAWAVDFGRGPDIELGWVEKWGWAGESVWAVDRSFEQVALLGSDGKITKSAAFPSWVRPVWRDRRQYPLFSKATWHAMYGDGTLLVEPSEIRRLFDTPGFDPDQKLLVRVDGDGRILRTIASAPAMDGRLLLRSGTERKTFNVPFFARTHMIASNDGERVAVVTPLTSDSGAFRVTVISAQGDTVFSRRYAVDARRASKAAVDSFLTSVKAFGRYTEQQVRDTIRKLVPAFTSPVAAVAVGVDYSVWVSFRTTKTDVRESEWLVIDAKGDAAGSTVLPRSFKVTAASVDRLWTIEVDRARNTNFIVRYRANARAVRRARSVSSSGSSTPSRPRE